MSIQTFETVVVGGSLAGCTAAILLARQGVKVAVAERHAKAEAHKQLCTHFIQPSALPVLRRLGLDRLIEEAGGLRNPLEVHTQYGWVGSLLEKQRDSEQSHGYNIRRHRLDPMVRDLARNTPGVTMMAGKTASSLVQTSGRIEGVKVKDGAEETVLLAPLVVAADGRNSAIARMAGTRAKTAPNCRFGILAPMRNVDLKRGETSQMWLTGTDAAYVFPNDGGVTLVVWMGLKEQLEACRDNPLDALQQRFKSLPDAPQLQEAALAGEVLTVKDYPNLWRPPVVRGMALIGDAQFSADPLWGVGCGWAFQMGAWLADAVCGELRAGAVPNAGLVQFEKQCGRLAGHRFLINDFARRRALNPIERLMFAAAAKDPGMALHVNRFGARIDGPATFLSPAAVLKALWINLRQPGLSANGTRVGEPLSGVSA